MSWASFTEFVAMGGYAPFVWGAYGVAALCIAAEIALVLRRMRKLRASAAGVPIA